LTVSFTRTVFVAVVAMTAFCVLSCGRASQTSDAAAPTPEAPATVAESTPMPDAAADSGSAQEAPQAPPSSGPIEPYKSTVEYAPSTAAGAVQGVPAATNTVPIVAVANYFADLPGIDMSGLDDGEREKFLHRANGELCTCGCKNDTLAHCYMNDPTCKIVKAMLLTVLEEVRSSQ
jgi:hypothetical protein